MLNEILVQFVKSNTRGYGIEVKNFLADIFLYVMALVFIRIIFVRVNVNFHRQLVNKAIVFFIRNLL